MDTSQKGSKTSHNSTAQRPSEGGWGLCAGMSHRWAQVSTLRTHHTTPEPFCGMLHGVVAFFPWFSITDMHMFCKQHPPQADHCPTNGLQYSGTGETVIKYSLSNVSMSYQTPKHTTAVQGRDFTTLQKYHSDNHFLTFTIFTLSVWIKVNNVVSQLCCLNWKQIIKLELQNLSPVFTYTTHSGLDLFNWMLLINVSP